MKLELPAELISKMVIRILMEDGRLAKGEDVHVEWVVSKHPLLVHEFKVHSARFLQGSDHPSTKSLLNPYH